MIDVLGFVRTEDFRLMDAVQYYRTYLPLREVNRHSDVATQIVSQETLALGVSDDDLGGRDIYTMARMYQLEDCAEFVSEIHRRSGVLVLDTDDDLTEDHRMVSGRGTEFKEVLGLVDYVTVSTPALAEHLAQYTQRPPAVLRNHIDAKWMRATTEGTSRWVADLTVGFSGSGTHYNDWQVAAAALGRISRDFPAIMPLLHGSVPDYLRFIGENRIYMEKVPFVIYPQFLSQFDILLCAVDPNDGFNCGKSALKPLEAMAVGAVPICSRFQPYMELAEAGAPVILVEEESRDGWYEAIRDVVAGLAVAPAREWLGDGPAWVKANRDMATSGWQCWADFYREIAE